MNNIPTAEEILDLLISQKDNVSEEENLDSLKQNIEVLKDWCKLHVKACKNEIAENAMVLEDDENPQLEHVWESYNTCDKDVTFTVDRDGIMKFYPLTNIK